MELKTKRLWGYYFSISGIVLIVFGTINYLRGVGGAVNMSTIGLLLAAIGMYINNRVLFRDKK